MSAPSPGPTSETRVRYEPVFGLAPWPSAAGALRRRAPAPRSIHGRGGFTLLEVLVALAILGLGITSVLQLMGGSARAAARTQATTAAVFVAEDLMEEIFALNESALRARAGERGDYAEHERRAAGQREGGLPAAGELPDPGPFSYAVEVTADRDHAGMYRIGLSVTWPGAAGGGVELATLRRFAPSEEAPAR